MSIVKSGGGVGPCEFDSKVAKFFRVRVVEEFFLVKTADKYRFPVFGRDWRVPFWCYESLNCFGHFVQRFAFTEDVFRSKRGWGGRFGHRFEEGMPVVSRVGDGLPRFPGNRIDLRSVLRGFDIFGSVACTRMLGVGRERGRGIAGGVGTGLRHGHKGSEAA